MHIEITLSIDNNAGQMKVMIWVCKDPLQKVEVNTAVDHHVCGRVFNHIRINRVAIRQ